MLDSSASVHGAGRVPGFGETSARGRCKTDVETDADGPDTHRVTLVCVDDGSVQAATGAARRRRSGGGWRVHARSCPGRTLAPLGAALRASRSRRGNTPGSAVGGIEELLCALCQDGFAARSINEACLVRE